MLPGLRDESEFQVLFAVTVTSTLDDCLFIYFKLITAARYCSMLIEEGGLQHLYNIKENVQTDPHVQRIAIAILDSLEKHIMRHGRPPPCRKQQQNKPN